MYEQSIIVAIVQGLMEFLPVSSSGHLIALAKFLNLKDQGIITDVVVHFGTFFAVLFYLRKDIPTFFKEGFSFATLNFNQIKTNIFYITFFASIPIIVFGLIYYGEINEMFRNNDDVLKFIGYSSIIFGIIIYLIDKSFSYFNNMNNIGFLGIFIIGIFQIFALIPGVSRSGSVMAGCRIVAINRIDTAKISLFLSIPAILGAMTLVLFKNIDVFLNLNPDMAMSLLVSFLVSFVVGFTVINFFINWTKKHNFTIFVIYRIIFGSALLLIAYKII